MKARNILNQIFDYRCNIGRKFSTFAGPNSPKTYNSILKSHVLRYLTPSTITYSWSFGSLLGFYFVLQILTGIWLTSHYEPSIVEGFGSIVKITQDVKYGSIVRNMHANGASMIFILIYLHIARGLYYRSFSYSRKSVWASGLVVFVLMMATAFLGYILPWGQMSYWGAQVITSFLTAIPYIGPQIQSWLAGGFGIGPTTLTRFHGLHIVLPFIIGLAIGIHLILVHKVGSTSGTQTKDDQGIGFHPYFSIKDLYGLFVSFIFYGYLVFFDPLMLSHPDNTIPANSLVTPTHIVPEWYFTPFYAILRAFPNKTVGIVAMVFAILVLALIPFITLWSNKLIQRQIKKNKINMTFDAYSSVWEFKSQVAVIHQVCFWLFCCIFLILMYLGCQPAEEPYVFVSRLFTFFYFFYFLVVIPVLPLIDFWIVHRRKK